jgi:hypothetical protein
MPRLAEGALESSYTAARREFELAAAAHGLVEHQLRLGDRCVRVRCAGERLAAVLLAALAHRVQHPDTGRRPDATIDIWERHGLNGEAIGFPWTPSQIQPGGFVRVSGEPGFVALHNTYSDAVTLVDRPRRALLHRIVNAESLPWWDRSSPLRAPLFWALAGTGSRLAHAGAVGDERGGVLLAGAPRSGKTTVALAAAAHGFGYLGDDSVLLYERGGLVAGSVYSTAGVRHDPTSDDAAVLDVATALPGSLRTSFAVRAVIVPRVAGKHTRLTRLEPSQALLAWAPSSALRLPFDDGEVVATLAGVVRQVPCFGLEVGGDPRELAAAVDEALALTVA